jgi:hypothetical protein
VRSELAAAHQRSVHDAAYLELVERLRLVPGCKVGPLRTAARLAGVTPGLLFPPPPAR